MTIKVLLLISISAILTSCTSISNVQKSKRIELEGSSLSFALPTNHTFIKHNKVFSNKSSSFSFNTSNYFDLQPKKQTLIKNIEDEKGQPYIIVYTPRGSDISIEKIVGFKTIPDYLKTYSHSSPTIKKISINQKTGIEFSYTSTIRARTATKEYFSSSKALMYIIEDRDTLYKCAITDNAKIILPEDKHNVVKICGSIKFK